MPTMREMVHERVERFEAGHQRLKTRRFGWLVRPAILTLGTLVLIVGIITIPLPGQGWLTTFLGVAILSLEAKWARAVLTWGVGVYDSFFAWYHRQPKATRWTLIVLMMVVILATFFLITWLTWAFGGIDVATPVFQDRLGWTRF